MICQNFNDNWKVWKDTDPFELVFRVPEDAVSVTLPHDAMFHEEQKADSVNVGSTGFLDGGAYKYYKQFYVPESYKDGCVLLRFEGVYRNAAVFVNQSLVGHCAFGYTDFSVEIQDYLKFGQENEILVAVKCGTKNSRWYSGAGIYRNVFLYHGPGIHIRPDGLRMTTLDVDSDGAAVSVSGKIRNDSGKAQTVLATVRIIEEKFSGEKGQAAVAEHTYPLRIRGRGQIELRKTIYLENVRLWSDETPDLYRIELSVKDEDGNSDTASVVSGIRKLTLDSRHGLRVNGREVKLRGACIHHDQSILGAATYDDYEYRRVKLLKEAGFNAVRSAHNHASSALLTACDRLGVYVMDELVDVWNKSKTGFDYALDFERSWEADVEAMVAADYNHPSVILYSTGNEIFEICTEKGMETSRMLGDKFHELDGTRYTTNGINGAFAAGDGLAQIVQDISGGRADTGRGDVNVFMGMMETKMPEIVTHSIISGILEKLETTMDVLGYNYMTARYLKDAETYPDRVMVGTETYPKQIAENWQAILQTPAVLGDFTWTGWDYMGEVAPVYPNLINQGGDLSATGVRRPVSCYREIVFGLKKGPCIAVQNPRDYGASRNFGPWRYTDCTFNYTYEGMEGHSIMIQVYGGGDSVELFLNGKSLGLRPCGKETAYETQFQTIYEPGELEAVAYEDGREIGRCTLWTAGGADHIQLSVDEDANYRELIFVDIEIRDKDGNTVYCGSSVSMEITGSAVLAAFGSENAKHRCGFESSETTVTDGHALAVLKRIGEGNVGISVKADGLPEAHLSV